MTDGRAAIDLALRALSWHGIAAVALFLGLAAGLGAAPYGFDDIRLGASYRRLAAALDFRDIHEAIAAQKADGRGTPDLGRRGYGCMRREDPFADVTCVSHEERVAGVPTREIRLHFLEGILQQFSITAEVAHVATVLDAVSDRNGEPRTDSSSGPPVHRWDNGESSIFATAGKDLVFVSFELAGYDAAVERKRSGAPPNACR